LPFPIRAFGSSVTGTKEFPMWVLTGGTDGTSYFSTILTKEADGLWFPAPVVVPFPLFFHSQVRKNFNFPYFGQNKRYHKQNCKVYSIHIQDKLLFLASEMVVKYFFPLNVKLK